MGRTGRPDAAEGLALDELLQAAGFGTLDDKPPLEAVKAVVSRLCELVSDAGLDSLGEEVCKAAAITKLETLKVRRAAAIIEAGFKPLKSAADATNTRFGLVDPDPWPERVDGSLLLDDLTDWISSHVHLEVTSVWAIALWAMTTWFVDYLYFAPLLVLTSPTKQSGKTLVLDLLQWVTRRGYLTSALGTTSAVLFRVNEESRPTFLIDEAEALGGRNADRERIALLNVGYRRGSMVQRCAERDHRVQTFDAFGFRALAAIGPLWDTIEDRAIIVRLMRKPRQVEVRRFNGREAEGVGRMMARRAARFAQDNAATVEQAEKRAQRPSWLTDRGCDSWAPLFGVAEAAGGHWLNRAEGAARALAGRRHDGDTRERLVQDLAVIFTNARRPEMVASAELVQALNRIETATWGDMRGGAGLSPQRLAALLRPFGVAPVQRRTSDGVKVRGWWYEDLAPLFERYVPPELGQPGHASDDGAIQAPPTGTPPGRRPTPQAARSPESAGTVPVVPVQMDEGRQNAQPGVEL